MSVLEMRDWWSCLYLLHFTFELFPSYFSLFTFSFLLSPLYSVFFIFAFSLFTSTIHHSSLINNQLVRYYTTLSAQSQVNSIF